MSAAPSREDPKERRAIQLGLVAYNLALLLLSPALLLWLLWRLGVKRKGLGVWRHRLGLVPRPLAEATPRVWLHAVSAGEMGSIKPVLDALRAARPEAYLALSTITPAGMTVAEKTCAAADARFYLPFDWSDCMALALWRVRPHLVVVAEKELWPNLLGLARLYGMPTLVVNGRVSDRMMRRARRARGFVRWLYRLPACFCVQSEVDAARLAELGVPADRVIVAGNTKADAMALRDPAAEAKLAQEIGAAPGEVWLVAGSTHPGEEEIVVEAFRADSRGVAHGAPAARPRVTSRGWRRCRGGWRRTASRWRAGAKAWPPPEAVVVLDTMGELRAAYGLATAGFVGGTLVPIGGHNLLEPVAAGRAVLFGPHTESCADVAELVLQAGVGVRVTDAAEMAREFLRLARDAAAREQVAARRGGADRGAAGGRAAVRQCGGRADRGERACLAAPGQPGSGSCRATCARPPTTSPRPGCARCPGSTVWPCAATSAGTDWAWRSAPGWRRWSSASATSRWGARARRPPVWRWRSGCSSRAGASPS